jgi:hypothetical protein
MSYRKSVAVLLLGGALGFMMPSAYADCNLITGEGCLGGALGSGGFGSWASVVLCPKDEFPMDVADAIDADPTTFPGGAEGFEFKQVVGCTEKDGAACQLGENGIRAVTEFEIHGPTTVSVPVGITASGSIARSDGNSFLDDGFMPGMKIGIRTPLNGPATASLNEVTIAAESGAVSDGIIYVVEDTLKDETNNGKIFSSRIDAISGGPVGCYVAEDDGTFVVESPLPVSQFSSQVDYSNVIRECNETAGTCAWTALVTDSLSDIDGHATTDDGVQLVNHLCAAGSPCTGCFRNPDKLNSKTLSYYAANSTFDDLESVHATEDANSAEQLTFDSRYPSSGLIVGDASVCPSATVSFASHGVYTGGFEDITSVQLFDGAFESETLNVAGGGGTVKYTFYPENQGVSCSQLIASSIRLENAPPNPGSELEILGNGGCRAQFDKDEVVANMRAAKPFVDGETRVLVARGQYNVTSSEQAPFESRDTVTITENFNETLAFSSASSCVNETVDGADEIVTQVVVKGGSLNGPVTVDVVDTGTGTARRKGGNPDYVFAPNPTTLLFDGSTNSQDVHVTINTDNKDYNETIVLELANISGPAGIGDPSVHTVTIDPTDQDGNLINCQ